MTLIGSEIIIEPLSIKMEATEVGYFYIKFEFSISGFEVKVGQRRCITHFHPLRITPKR